MSTKRPPEILTADEVLQLLRAPSERAPTGIRNRALIAAMYGAGLRVQETLDLKPSSITIDTRTVRILHGKNDEARTIGIDKGALFHVVRWMDLRRARGIRGKTLFCTLTGGPLSQRYVRAMLVRTANRVGIDKRVYPHGLRHTCAAELEAAGVPVTVIQKQLGHKNLNTTATYLDHISPSARIAIIANRRDVL